MVKDIITYNKQTYQLSTVDIDGMSETMIFPIINGIVSGNEVYCFRTLNEIESFRKHIHIKHAPEKYLNPDAITEYLKSKKAYFDESDIEKFQFPFEYLNKYLLGEIDYDTAIDRTIEEICNIIVEYIEAHETK